MADNKTNISYDDLIMNMNDKTNITIKTIKVLGENIDVKTVLTMEEFEHALNGMLRLIFTEDGEYNAFIKDFAVRICTVFAYTGVIIPEDFTSEADDLYKLMYCTNFYDAVTGVINKTQYDVLLNALDEEINKQNYSNIDRVNRKVAELTSMIETLGKQFEDIIGDVSEEDVNKLLSAIENVNIDEKKLVEAFVAEKYSDANAEAKEE